MGTFCHNQLSFKSFFGKKVMVDFRGGRISFDGGGLILREIDDRYGMSKEIARCLSDQRDGSRVITNQLFCYEYLGVLKSEEVYMK